ncbi:MAG: tartrate dehydrogenase [Deltaproteobacteria bacterium]|nr:tartrate dehydrogenase [Deltaproteobacteria bacterium]
MREYKIAVIPGDGIGKEVIPAGIQVLKVLEEYEAGLQMKLKMFPWGCDFYHDHGRMMPDDGLEILKKFDAIYFGAVGHPSVPDHVSLWGLRLNIVQRFDQYANIRPTRVLPGITSPLRDRGPKDIDWVIVRENSEGEYSGVGGVAHQGFPEEVSMDVSVFTRAGVRRIMTFAFELAQKRTRRHLTLITKSNAQRHGMVMWDKIFEEVATQYPDVTTDRMLVDAATTRMVLKPDTLDVLVATNLHADILSDLAAALSGSLGIGATANLNPEKKFPSLFEPIHGSAFDIMGKGIANPIGAFWTAALMLEHLGLKKASDNLMKAIEAVTASGRNLPVDLGGQASTTQVADAVCEALRDIYGKR